MSGAHKTGWALAALVAAGFAAWFVRYGAGVGVRKGDGAAVFAKDEPPGVRGRAALADRPSRPCALEDGWVVAHGSGEVAKFTLEGLPLWRATFSNEVFDAPAAPGGGVLVLASAGGRVFGLDARSGAVRWQRETDGRFRHRPLAGTRGGEAAVWLVSQEDGRLFCLRADDGALQWVTEATNRCDGEPAAWRNRLAYGNCDGAVYVFDAATGALVGTVEVGADDQMAGGVLALPDGRLVTGTRQGNLAVVNAATLTLESVAKVSESEAFVTPVLCFGELIAMGVREGTVTVWSREADGGLRRTAALPTGQPVRSLVFVQGRLYALAGGALRCYERPDREAWQLVLGDEVGELCAHPGGLIACVADGALVVVKGGGG